MISDPVLPLITVAVGLLAWGWSAWALARDAARQLAAGPLGRLRQGGLVVALGVLGLACAVAPPLDDNGAPLAYVVLRLAPLAIALGLLHMLQAWLLLRGAPSVGAGAAASVSGVPLPQIRRPREGARWLD
jgi:hypothetical protein